MSTDPKATPQPPTPQPPPQIKPCPSQCQTQPGMLESCLLPAGHKGSHVGATGGKWVSPDHGATA